MEEGRTRSRSPARRMEMMQEEERRDGSVCFASRGWFHRERRGVSQSKCIGGPKSGGLDGLALPPKPRGTGFRPMHLLGRGPSIWRLAMLSHQPRRRVIEMALGLLLADLAGGLLLDSTWCAVGWVDRRASILLCVACCGAAYVFLALSASSHVHASPSGRRRCGHGHRGVVAGVGVGVGVVSRGLGTAERPHSLAGAAWPRNGANRHRGRGIPIKSSAGLQGVMAVVPGSLLTY